MNAWMIHTEEKEIREDYKDKKKSVYCCVYMCEILSNHFYNIIYCKYNMVMAEQNISLPACVERIRKEEKRKASLLCAYNLFHVSFNFIELVIIRHPCVIYYITHTILLAPFTSVSFNILSTSSRGCGLHQLLSLLPPTNSSTLFLSQ